MSKRALSLVLILSIVMFISFRPENLNPSYVNNIGVDFSSNPPAAATGAPGEANCTDCHSGSTLPASGVVTFSFSGTNNLYKLGESYDITIGKTGSSKTGFEMTVLDSYDNFVGNFTAGTNSSLITYAGREYIRHSTSDGVDSWTFTWDAPTTSVGDVTFYYALNEANNNGSTVGDMIYLGTNTITYDIISGVVENKEKLNSVKMILTGGGHLNVSLKLQNSASIYFSAQDINGKQLDYHNFGTMNSGVQSLSIPLDTKYSSGVYLFTIFIDNKPHTTKIALP